MHRPETVLEPAPSLAGELRALREAVALSEMEHVRCLRVSGDQAFEALEHLCAAELFLVDGQMRHTLMLREDGTPLADLYVCCDDDAYLLLMEVASDEALEAHLQAHLPRDLEVRIEDLSATHRLLSLNGPYAWDALGEWIGSEVVGLPYMSFFHIDPGICFRAGKTGEYGYDLLLAREAVPEVRARLLEIGEARDLREVGLPALEQCALENWFFNIRREGQAGLTPLELQLQWRISSQKEYVGAEAIRARRAEGIRSRLTCVVSEGPLTVGSTVVLGERPIGRLLNTGFSTIRGDWVGMALLELPWAQPGVAWYEALEPSGRVVLRTVSPPVINNRSLYVDPRQHSYASRGELAFPSLV